MLKDTILVILSTTITTVRKFVIIFLILSNMSY